MNQADLDGLVQEFGRQTKAKLGGGGEPEDALRVPIEHLATAFGDLLGLKTELDGEYHLTERSSRPDFAVRVQGAVVGYLEVKKAGLSLNPTTFSGNNKTQWERLKDLPNLIYTNGSEWRLYRGDGVPPVVSQMTGGHLEIAGSALTPDSNFHALLTDFLRWKPAPIRTVPRLVRTIAPITRMLRTKVQEQLGLEHRNVAIGQPAHEQQFLGLASDWRKLLFPDASDDVFADGYAQTVTFALLLARTEFIDLTTTSLHDVGQKLGTEHSLMGRALQLLTQDVTGDFLPTLELLKRVIGAVEWQAIRKNRDTYLHLYENFLAEYDPELRKATGTYYTPHQVVDDMVRLAEEVLVTKLGKTTGFRDPSVTTIDPAMGTGGFLHAIIEHVAEEVGTVEGTGAVAGAVTELASRLIGFEIQLGSYAVAELRTTDLLRSFSAEPPKAGMKMFVADTLSDPGATETQLSSGLGAISASKREANRIKRDVPVTLVIGNPPYSERALGSGGWIENGSDASKNKKTGGQPVVLLDDFREPGNGSREYVLRNMYVFFWRFATWKVFESIPTDRAGIVCFISTAGYLRGPGFRGMRSYLRREADEGWIIDLTPEGQTPDVPTRVFPGVRQPLAIGIFVRYAEHDQTKPAPVWFRSLAGSQADKFKQLNQVTINGDWWPARNGWNAPFTPEATHWDAWPALSDLFPWVSPGVAPHRTWVYAPSAEVLVARWAELFAETDTEKQATLFKKTRDADLNRFKQPLTNANSVYSRSLRDETPTTPSLSPVAYRAFDRQTLISDHRTLDTARPDLWRSITADQVFIFEQHAHPVASGLPLLVSTLIPDMDHLNNRGGRVLPMLHPDGSPNMAPGLLDVLSAKLGTNIGVEQVLAYVVAISSHAGFTEKFAEELTTPGVRIPFTRKPELFGRAVELGEKIVWLQTYATAAVDEEKSRPVGDVRFGWPLAMQPLSRDAVTVMPERLVHEEAEQAIRFVDVDGNPDGSWGPVSREVFDYTAGGMNVLGSWFKYRKRIPGGKKTSPLDYLHVDQWPLEWTVEFTNLLTLLSRLVALEVEQKVLLEAIMVEEIISSAELGVAGVTWPVTAKDRRARQQVQANDSSPVFDIDWTK